jgi:hypothetical protein
MSANKTRRWPDLSQYGVTLGILAFDGGKQRLVFSDENGRYPHVAKNMGFQRTRWPGVWVRDDTRLEPAAFRAIFPAVRIEERTDEAIATAILGAIRDVVDATRARRQSAPTGGDASPSEPAAASSAERSAPPVDQTPISGESPEASLPRPSFVDGASDDPSTVLPADRGVSAAAPITDEVPTQRPTTENSPAAEHSLQPIGQIEADTITPGDKPRVNPLPDSADEVSTGVIASSVEVTPPVPDQHPQEAVSAPGGQTAADGAEIDSANNANAEEPDGGTVSVDLTLGGSDFDEADGEMIDLSPVTLVEAASPLGSNHLGEEVFVAHDGRRFVRTMDDSATTPLVMEGPRTTQLPAESGRFLRGDTPQALQIAAEGFVRSIAEGRIARVDDFSRFVRAVIDREMVDEDPEIERIAAVIDQVRVRRLASLVNNRDADAFGAALRLHNGVQYYALIKNKMTPLPVGVVMQHIASAMPAGSSIRALNDDRGEFRIFDESASGFVQAEEGQTQDVLLSTAEPKLLERPAEILNTAVSRMDHAHVLQSLARMAPNGLGIFVIGADGTPGRIGPSSRRFLDTLATFYHVEGIVDVDGTLTGAPGAAPTRIIVVGGRRETPGHGGLPSALPYVTDYDALWAWGTNIAEAVRQPGSVPFAARGGVAATSGELANMFQAPYVPTSLLSDPALMVPRNMASPLRRAMLEIMRSNPRIDDYLAEQLGMSQQELKLAFNAEQADALVLALKRMETGLGFMEADETGVGKGRVLAGIALARRRRGQPVVFLTEREALFTDFWRDLEDIGADKHFSNIFIVNDDVSITSTRTGDVIARSASRDDVAKVMRSMALPEDSHIVFGTYSQFNRDPVKAARAEAEKNNAGTGAAAAGTVKALNTKIASMIDAINDDRKTKGRATAKRVAVEAADELADPSLLASLPVSALKPLWIGRAVVDAALIMDESHNAAGEESNTNLNLVHAVMGARDCVYSSATFARGERNMRIYRRLFPASVDVENLHETLKKGGEPLQEALTSMLAEDGALVRREHDCSMLKFHTKVDTRRLKRNERDSDQLAEILALMASLSREVRHHTDAISDDIRKKLEALHIGADGKPTLSRSELKKVGVVNRSPIGNSLHTIMRSFIAIQKVDLAIESGVEAIKQGQKPVFVISHTMEAELTRALERAREAKQAKETDHGTIIQRPGFYHLLMDTLERLVGCSLDGKQLELENEPKFAEIIRLIEEKIKAFPNLPLIPLDQIREGLEESGYQVAELSGRKLRAHTLKGGKVLLQKITAKERRAAVARFNNGDAEGIILTAAGNSGISLHASPRFINTAQRVLIEVEVPANIVERTQFFGRVNRNGQISHPLIVTLSSGLPAEERTLAMSNNHMRKMSASVTGNRENAALTKDIADVLNQIGNQVVCYFLEAQPELARKLDIDLPEKMRDEEDQFALYGTKYVHEMFKRLCLLLVADQRQIISQITKEFNNLVEELDATGANPLKARFYDVHAKLVKSEPLEYVGQSTLPTTHEEAPEVYDLLMPAVAPVAPPRGSSFDKPVNLSEIEYTEYFESYTPREIKKLVAEGQEALDEDIEYLMGGQKTDTEQFFDEIVQTVLNRRDEMMEKALRKEDANVAAALADPNPNVVKTIQYNAEQVVSILAQMRVGSVMRFTDPLSGEEIDGAIVTRIRIPDLASAHTPGRYNFNFIAPGRKNKGYMSFATLIKQGGFEIRGPYDALTLKAFSERRTGSHIVSRSVLDGNLFRAAEMSLQAEVGTQASYSDEHGMTHRAVVLRYNTTRETFSNLPLRIHDPELAIRYFSEVQAGEMSSLSNKTKANRGITVIYDGNDLVVSVPGTSNWSAWLRNQPAFMAVTGRFEGTTEAVMAIVPRSACRELIEALYATGITLYAHPKGRTVVNETGAAKQQSTRTWFTDRIGSLNGKSTSTEDAMSKSVDPMAVDMGKARRRSLRKAA